MTWFLPDVCEGSVSEDSSLEMPPDVFEGSVSGDSCLEPPPEQQEIMWMNKIVQAKNSPPYLHQCNFSEITEIVMSFQYLEILCYYPHQIIISIC